MFLDVAWMFLGAVLLLILLTLFFNIAGIYSMIYRLLKVVLINM